MTYVPRAKTSHANNGMFLHYWEELSLEFKTTPEYVASVLPPCFQPVEEPNASAVISTYRLPSGADHPGGGSEYECAMIYLEATYKEHRGWFALLMLVSGDMPVTMGREMLGEPKKTGNIRMYHHGDGTYAYGERNGTRLIQIDADLGPDLGPNQTTVFGLELKGQPAPDFVSLHADPWVVVTTQVAENVISREGSGRLYLTGSPFDPVDEVPVVEVGAARYVAGKVDFGAVTWEQLPSREEYVPHIMSRRFYDYATVESPVYR